MRQRSRHDEFLAQLPERWEIVPVDALGEIVGGGTPSRENPLFWDGDIPWVTPTEITSLRTNWLTETRERITEAGLRSSAARRLPIGTVLITTRATVGAVALAAIEVSTNQGFRSIICNASADPHFYYHFFKRISTELRRLASGSTFDEISRTDLGRILVPRPPLDEQRRIARILDAADERIEATERERDKVVLLRAALTENLLTGRAAGDDG